jgi:hypothetical protein
MRTRAKQYLALCIMGGTLAYFGAAWIGTQVAGKIDQISATLPSR